MASISFASESLMDPRILVKLDKYIYIFPVALDLDETVVGKIFRINMIQDASKI